MLRRGASLGEIGDVLGHRHPQTTTIYAKVDIQALRKLALPWPALAGFGLLLLGLAMLTALVSGRQAMGADVVRAVKDDW